LVIQRRNIWVISHNVVNGLAFLEKTSRFLENVAERVFKTTGVWFCVE
jgi:hypothetical protein